MENKRRTKNFTGQVKGLWEIKEFLGYNTKHRQLYRCIDIFGCSRIFSSKMFYNKNFGNHLYDSESISARRLLYAIHSEMLKRCYSSKSRSYKTYGARGIKVCNEWLGEKGSFNYLLWAVKNGWKKGLTIDRININGDYCPSNCRFITKSENARYKTNTRLSFEIADRIRKDFENSSLNKTDFCLKFLEDNKNLEVGEGTILAVLNNHSWVN